MRRRLGPRLKHLAYEIFDEINRGFQLTYLNFERLARLNVVPEAHLRPCRIMAEELRSLTNRAFLATMRDIETHNAAYFGKLRVQWEHRPYPRPTAKPKPRQ